MDIFILALIAFIMAFACGCYVMKEIYTDRFWKVEQINRKHFYKLTGGSEFLCDRITNMYYEGVFYGKSADKLEQQAKEPNVIFIITDK